MLLPVFEDYTILVTQSPDNRKSVTIIEVIFADGRQPPSPLNENLKGGEIVGLSPAM